MPWYSVICHWFLHYVRGFSYEQSGCWAGLAFTPFLILDSNIYPNPFILWESSYNPHWQQSSVSLMEETHWGRLPFHLLGLMRVFLSCIMFLLPLSCVFTKPLTGIVHHPTLLKLGVQGPSNLQGVWGCEGVGIFQSYHYESICSSRSYVKVYSFIVLYVA